MNFRFSYVYLKIPVRFSYKYMYYAASLVCTQIPMLSDRYM